MTKNIMSVDSLFLQYEAELKHGLNKLAGHNPKKQFKQQLHKLIIDKLPKERITESGWPETSYYILGYTKAIGEMTDTINQLFSEGV